MYLLHLTDVPVHHFLDIVIRVEWDRRVELTVNKICGIVILGLNIRIDMNFLLIGRYICLRFMIGEASFVRRTLRSCSGHGSIASIVGRARIIESPRRVRIIIRLIVTFGVEGRWLHITSCFCWNTGNWTRHDWTARLTTEGKNELQENLSQCYLSNGLGSGILSKGRLRKNAWRKKGSIEWPFREHPTIGLSWVADGDQEGLAFPWDHGVADSGRWFSEGKLRGLKWDPLKKSPIKHKIKSCLQSNLSMRKAIWPPARCIISNTSAWNIELIDCWSISRMTSPRWRVPSAGLPAWICIELEKSAWNGSCFLYFIHSERCSKICSTL